MYSYEQERLNQSESPVRSSERGPSSGPQGARREVGDERGNDVQELAQFLEEDPNPVLRVTRDGTLAYANRGSWPLLAFWSAEVGGKLPDSWIETVARAMHSQVVEEIEVDIGYKTILIAVVPIAEKGYVNLYGLDVTRRKHVEEKLRLNAQVFENATEGIMICDPDLRILDVNRAFCTITGYSREEILGESAMILDSGHHDAMFFRRMWQSVRQKGSWQGEIWDRRKNGQVYPKWLSLSAVRDEKGEISRYIALFSDITVMKQSEEQLYHMAHYDSLTGLANRRYFRELLETTLRNANRSGQTVALMFIDLDSFKLVNDNFGHRAGDQLLVEVAQRVLGSVRSTDTVARMGGDEFTVLLPDLPEPSHAAPIARKILTQVAEPLRLDGQELYVTSSVGIAIYPDDVTDAEGLLQGADIAMYHAKTQGKNSYQFFSREMNARVNERLMLQVSLHRAIESREFVIHYQPQVDVASERLIGLEALVRWNNPDRGLLGPGEFIDLAEETGQICEIGEQVMRSACRQGKVWRERWKVAIMIGVNITARQLRRPDFIPTVESILTESDFPPEFLELELTENTLIDDNSETLRRLTRLKQLGVSLAIDDFGTKYSSLAYLKRLPVSRLKIDRTFIRDLDEHSEDVEIVSAILAMGRSFKLEVVAEGVENERQLRVLRELGCTRVQGNYFGSAQPPEAIERILSSASVEISPPLE